MVHAVLSITIQREAIVSHGGRQYIVKHVFDLTSLLAKDIETGEVKRLEISAISAAPTPAGESAHPDLDEIPDERWELAQSRFEIIRPLLADPQRTRAKVQARAEEFGKHVNTLYAWIRLFEDNRTLTVLIPQDRNDKGKTKLDPKIEEIVKKAINEEYLPHQQKCAMKVYGAVKRLCRNAGLTPPHPNTVRNRLNALPEHLKIHRRREPQSELLP
jgi:putative transposase